ncbi:hypothetical protein BAUCODRAFT_152438 [Baudoinia panamericana UAMH 10762]|uniref:Peptidase S53 domain-containing protein n=1 Tax=Baudoinia panamericana (strain UAMH 10762) TaxID=717646 RepID=M2MIQ2_BAUPA|nr:uncharacterized protein BAUCODRAFT_152438 [Baudoinia panamericana UAMH 10762]EMC91148.1 hypothetical protein BAUCODRAFT_152438 [Baudoinia panamericana UAMH 10762]
MLLPTLATGLLIGSAVCTTHVVHEKRWQPPMNRGSRLDPNAIVPLRIALKQSNLETGYDRLIDVSHPSSANFGKHLSTAEVHELFAPAAETTKTVKDWLLNAGVYPGAVKEYVNKGWLAVDVPAKIAESLLSTEYYEHDSNDGVKIGCDSYSLPAHVSKHVDFVKPGVKLSPPMKKRTLEKRQNFPHGGPPSGPRGPPGPIWQPHSPPDRNPGWHMPPGAQSLPPELQACSVNITPPCIKALYRIPNATLDTPGQEMGLYETYDAFSQADIDLFFEHFAPYVPQGTSPTVLSVDGGTAPVPAASVRNGGESDIDITLAYSLIYPQSVTVYQVDDLPNSSGMTNVTGFLNTFLDAIDGSYCGYSAYGITGDSPGIDATYPDNSNLTGAYKGQLECGTYKLTNVLSVSYGEAEAYLPKPYVERQCNEFMKLGLQGHSILFASGDYGVASFPGSNENEFGCLSAPGMNGTIYNPDYPVGCPYITAVGATRLYPNQTVYDPESAMQVNLQSGNRSAAYEFFATGGGFSNLFTPPSYQAQAVANYLAKYGPDVPSYVANSTGTNYGENGGVFNRAGRGYPDVAANGAYLLDYTNQTLEHWFGTSLSSPIFGSVLTLINEQRAQVGKGPVGFVNPTLYANPQVLNDITNGSNPNCGSSGFETAPGWDPVTGLGTPNYPKMLELWMRLP